ncbi:MAG: hypothetical protein EOO89_24430 [Pedobacter sp.]|nr:MAG: hypothetical protein EOO89_24430 [Pedobacter sp.]
MKKSLLGVFALMIAFAASAFTTTRAVQWTFKGSNTGQILSAAQYQQGLAAPSGCGSGSDLPCIVNFPDGINTATELNNYLTASGRTNAQILALSPQKRD